MKKVFYSISSVVVLTMIYQIFNMVKTLVLSNFFGASAGLDTFYLANNFTVAVFNIFGVALTTVLIPVFSNSALRKETVLNAYLTIIYLSTLVVSVLLVLILLLCQFFLLNTFQLFSDSTFLILLCILLVSQFFRISTAFSTAVLQAENRFVFPKVALLFTAAIPVVYLLATKQPSLAWLSFSITISYIIEWLLMLWERKRVDTYHYQVSLQLDDQVKGLLKNTLPIIFSSAIFQFQIIFSNFAAGWSGEGVVTMFTNANQIIGMFQVLFLSNIISMAYPKISRDAAKSHEEAADTMIECLNYTNILAVLLVWGYIAVGRELIHFLFVRGNFTVANADVVFLFGVFLILAFPFSVIRDYFYRLLYSVNRVAIPSKNAVQAVIANVFFIIAFKPFFRENSICIALMSGTIFSALVIMYKTKKIGIPFAVSKIFVPLTLYNLFGLIMFLIVEMIKVEKFGFLVNFAINVCICSVIYAVLILALFLLKKLRIRQIS